MRGPAISAERVEWLIAQRRALAPDEQDELYRGLRALHMREWRAAHPTKAEMEQRRQREAHRRHKARRAELVAQEMEAEAAERHRAEEALLLKRVLRESCKPVLPQRTFEQRLQSVMSGKVTIYTVSKPSNDLEFTAGGVSSGWAA